MNTLIHSFSFDPIDRMTLARIYESGQLVIGNELGDQSISDETSGGGSEQDPSEITQAEKSAKTKKRKKIIAERVKNNSDTPLGFLIRLSGTYFKKTERAPAKKHSGTSKNVTPITSRPQEVFVKKSKIYPSSSREKNNELSRIQLYQLHKKPRLPISVNEQPVPAEPEVLTKRLRCSSARIHFEKVNLSIAITNKKQKENLNESNADTCVICCDRNSSSVFMPCGHGGICDECGLDIFQKKGQCHLCQTVSFLQWTPPKTHFIPSGQIDLTFFPLFFESPLFPLHHLHS